MTIQTKPSCARCKASSVYMRDIFNELVCSRCGWVYYENLTVLKNIEDENLLNFFIPYGGNDCKWSNVPLTVGVVKKNRNEQKSPNTFGTPLCPVCQVDMVFDNNKCYDNLDSMSLYFHCTEGHAILVENRDGNSFLWDWNLLKSK